MPDTTTLADYPPGSPEAAEWRGIRERNTEEFRRRMRFDRFGAERAVRLSDVRAGAEQLVYEVEEHRALIATIATSGWLLFPDVSEHQGTFNWQWCKDAGMRIGCYKATEGRTYIDGQQSRNRDEIRRLGLAGMAYGFVYWSAEYDNNPALWNEQGKWFAQHAPAEFAHAIDVEMLCSGKSTDVARVVAGYRSVHPGHPLLIYTNRSLYASRSKGTPANPSTLGLLEWHAGITNGAYTGATGSLPAEWGAISTLTNSLTGFPPEVIWQFTDHGAVAGQLVDGNGFKGTADDFRSAFIEGGEVMPTAQEIAAAVWGYPVGSAWEDDPAQSAAKALRSAQRYAIHGGFVGTAPGGGTTVAAQILAASGDEATLAQIADTLTSTLRAVVPGMSQAVVAGIRADFPEVQVDEERLGVVVGRQLDEHLASLRIVSDAPHAQADVGHEPVGEG